MHGLGIYDLAFRGSFAHPIFSTLASELYRKKQRYFFEWVVFFLSSLIMRSLKTFLKSCMHKNSIMRLKDRPNYLTDKRVGPSESILDELLITMAVDF